MSRGCDPTGIYHSVFRSPSKTGCDRRTYHQALRWSLLGERLIGNGRPLPIGANISPASTSVELMDIKDLEYALKLAQSRAMEQDGSEGTRSNWQDSSGSSVNNTRMEFPARLIAG